MPAVARTSPAKIVAAARRIVERHGPGALSMQAVAQAVGIQAPSLYKRFADRAALLRAVSLGVSEQMRKAVELAATTGSPADDLRAIARAQRAYAQRSPHLYDLVFASRDPAAMLAPSEYGSAIVIMIERMREHGAPEYALEGARTLVAYTHGFSSMESAGAFHLGGDVDLAFEFGLQRILDSLYVKRSHPSR